MWKSSTCLEWVVSNFTFFRIRMLNSNQEKSEMSQLFSICYWLETMITRHRLKHTFSCGFSSYFLELHVILCNLKNIEYFIFTQEVGFKFFLFMMHVLNKCFKVDLNSLSFGGGLNFKDLIVVISKKPSKNWKSL